MTEQLAKIRGAAGGSAIAYCYACRTPTPLATRGATVRLVPGLVPRAERKDGLPRYGPPRRSGHGDARRAGGFLVDASSRDIGNPVAIYVNCPACDRGQVVRWSPRVRPGRRPKSL